MKRTAIITCSAILICAIALIVVCNLVVNNSSKGQCYSDIDAIPHSTYGLLLYTGCSAQSPLYRARMQAAIDLYEAGKVDYILISGENKYEDFAELDSMVVTLQKQDIPVAGIDEIGKNTLMSLQNIGLQTSYFDSIIIISQHFQNVRALYYAHKIYEPCPIAYNATDTEKWYEHLIRMCGEWLLRTKAVLMSGKIKRLPDETETLAFWLPEKDSVNHAFVLTAEPLWKLRNADEQEVSNFTYLSEWQERCEGVLLHTFDSIRPNSVLDIHQKTDSMLNILSAFFSDIDEYSNWDDILLMSLDYPFNTYKVVDKSKILINQMRDRRKEVESWYEFEEQYTRFCILATSLEWWGGSGSGLADMVMLSYIQQIRKKDLDNQLQQHINNDDFDIDAEVICMKNAIDTVLSTLEPDEVKYTDYEQEDEDFYDSNAEYISAYERIKNQKETLLLKYEQWLNIRKKQRISTLNTANLLSTNVQEIVVFEDESLFE